MKKQLLIILICLASFNFSQGQVFKLEDTNGNDVTNSQVTVQLTADLFDELFDEIQVGLVFKNLTDFGKAIKVKRVIDSIVPGVRNDFCWILCYPENTNISPDPLNVDANGSTNSFYTHYRPRMNYGTSNYTFIFFDNDNPSDSVFVKFSFTSGTLGIGNKNNSKPTGLSFYPNPSNDVLNVAINPSSNSMKEIKITNILGTVVRTQNLGKLENSVAIKTEDLEDGVYFVSVVSNGKIENTKRLVVKH
jgi:hypothetical protein